MNRTRDLPACSAVPQQTATPRAPPPEASSFKYLGIIIRNDLNWADHVNYTLRKAWKALHFVKRVLKKRNNKTKRVAYTALVRETLEYGAVCWDPYLEGQVRRFKSGANESG